MIYCDKCGTQHNQTSCPGCHCIRQDIIPTDDWKDRRIRELEEQVAALSQTTPITNGDIRRARDQSLEIIRLRKLVALLSPFLVSAVEDMVAEVEETGDPETRELLDRFGTALWRASEKKKAPR